MGLPPEFLAVSPANELPRDFAIILFCAARVIRPKEASELGEVSNAGNKISKVHQDLIGYTDLVFTDHKHKFTNDPVDRRPNILIDDKPENIDNFRLAGGIGIRYQANQDDLEEYLFVELEKAIDIINATPKSSS